MTPYSNVSCQCAVDIGNSRIKWRPVSGTLGTLSVESPCSLETFQQTMSRCVSPQPIRWYLSSVSLHKKNQVVQWLATYRGQDEVHVVSYHDVPMTVRVDYPEKLGIDRLIAAFAAWKKLGNGPILVIDCGTATTVDFVTETGEFGGGAILPGIGTMCRSLHTDTAVLPEIMVERQKLQQKLVYPATNTVSAIQTGVIAATVGAAIHLRDIAGKQTGKTVPIVLTGGDAELCFSSLQPYCDTVHFWPELVLDGIDQLFGECSR